MIHNVPQNAGVTPRDVGRLMDSVEHRRGQATRQNQLGRNSRESTLALLLVRLK